MEAKVTSLIKLITVGASAGAGFDGAFSVFSNFVDLPVWGVPVTTFGAAAAGAALSLFFGEPIPNRRSLWGQIAAACLFGTALAVLSADGFNWDWAHKHMSMFALMCAALIRWFLPVTIERVKVLIKDLKLNFKLFKSDNKGDPQ